MRTKFFIVIIYCLIAFMLICSESSTFVPNIVGAFMALLAYAFSQTKTGEQFKNDLHDYISER